MRNYYCRTTHKFEANVLNEDAVIAKKNILAVSDGAGGGGVFAERWSRYLLRHLPVNPIASFKELDDWIDDIWEPFYNDCEAEAKNRGGLFLEKFYDEGSFATLAAAWKVNDNVWKWITYGDSVVFCYEKKDNVLTYSPIKLADFNLPPFLISDKDPLKEDGFKEGTFTMNDDSVIFIASDTLAHYILMMYEVDNLTNFKEEVEEAIKAKTKNSNFIEAAMNVKFSFPVIIDKLLNKSIDFRGKLKTLERHNLLGHDDYSLSVHF